MNCVVSDGTYNYTMASVDGGLGGSCFFDGDCGGPLYCHVEGVGGKFQVRVCLI